MEEHLNINFKKSNKRKIRGALGEATILALMVTYLSIVILLVYVYLNLFYIIDSLFFNQAALSNKSQLIMSTVLALFLAFIYKPLYTILRKNIDKIFFRAHYDPQMLLAKLGKSIAATLNLSDLTNSLLSEIISEMKIRAGYTMLMRESKIIWVKGEGERYHPEFNEEKICKLIESVGRKSHDKILVYEEMYESEEKKIMFNHNLRLVLPLVVKDEIIGVMFFTEKISGELYSLEDINVLKIIAPEIAVAVKNALSYEEIKRFNITLEEEIRQATKKLEDTNQRLKEVDKLKDEFVSIASHELRTPMTAIKSYLWLALNKSPQLIEPKLKKYLEIAYDSSDRLIKLVNDMLTISRIEDNRYELKMERVNFCDLAKQIYEELKIEASKKDINITIDDPCENYLVYADKDKIREVITNIIGNALKFTPEKGSIKLSFTKNDSILSLSISDTGPGMSQDDMSKLFQKFERLDHSYTKSAKVSGTGLGLYISKQIITLHKGEIKVESELGKGSTFSILLPEYISNNLN